MSRRRFRAFDDSDAAELCRATATRIREDEPCLVQTHYAAQLDVNEIVRRYGVDGPRPFVVVDGVYADFSEINDLDGVRERLEVAQRGFEALDPKVRAKYRNDPGLFYAAVSQMDEETLKASGIVKVEKALEAPDWAALVAANPDAFARFIAPVAPAAPVAVEGAKPG